MTDRVEIEVQCTRCGRAWLPSHDDYVRDVWRLCPRCRGDPGRQGIRRHDASDQTLTDDLDASTINKKDTTP